MLLLVGDALNIGQNLLSRRQMLLLRIRRSFTWNCLESEFGSSPFSIIHWSFVNPKTDRLQRIHLSVGQGGKKSPLIPTKVEFLIDCILVPAYFAAKEMSVRGDTRQLVTILQACNSYFFVVAIYSTYFKVSLSF